MPGLAKCKCPKCGDEFEYPSGQAGMMVGCPHCSETIELPSPEEIKKCPDCGATLRASSTACATCEDRREEKKRRGRSLVLMGVSAVLVLGLAGVGAWHFLKPPPPPPPKSYIYIEQPAPHLPKSINDLQPGRFSLEKRRGSDLTMAVGDIQNASANDHNDIHAAVDLLDRNGAKIGTVTDFVTFLGAHEVWHFLATVSDTNATSVRFASLKEGP